MIGIDWVNKYSAKQVQVKRTTCVDSIRSIRKGAHLGTLTKQPRGCANIIHGTYQQVYLPQQTHLFPKQITL